MYFVCEDVRLAGVLSVMERKKKPKTFEVWSVFERLSESRWPQIENRGNSVVCACRVINKTLLRLHGSFTHLLLEVKVHRRGRPDFRLQLENRSILVFSSESSRFTDVNKSQEDRYQSHSSCSDLSYEALLRCNPFNTKNEICRYGV